MVMAEVDDARTSTSSSTQLSTTEQQQFQKTFVQSTQTCVQNCSTKVGISKLFVPVQRPKDLPRWYRLSLLVLLTICASIDPIASTSFFPILAQIATYFDRPRAVTNLCSTLDFAGVATTALYWSWFARNYGRKKILVVVLTLTTLFTALGASSTSLGMLIAMRVLSSASAAGIIVTGVAAVGDMWETSEKGFAMGVFFLGPFMSPALGPVIGGALGQRWGWRSILWFIAIWAGLSMLLVVLILPETRQENSPLPDLCPTGAAGPTSLKHHPPGRQRRLLLVLTPFYRPLKILALLRYLLINLLLVAAAFSYGVTAIFSITMQSTLSAAPYRFNTFSVGLMFIPYAVGAILASVLGGKLSDYAMRRRAARSGTLLPEYRVHINACVACILQLLALPTLGWLFRLNQPWYAIIVPALAIGVSCGLNLGILSTILVELIPSQAPGLIAMNSVGRNLCGAIGGSVAQPLIDRIGTGWLYVGLCALVSIIITGVYVSIVLKGGALRADIWRAEGVAKEDDVASENPDHARSDLASGDKNATTTPNKV